jgi:hypothetical protein
MIELLYLLFSSPAADLQLDVRSPAHHPAVSVAGRVHNQCGEWTHDCQAVARLLTTTIYSTS